METVQIFNYEGSSITFELANGEIMINATEMAKPFRKLPGHFLANKQTKEYIKALEKRYSVIGIPITKVVQGGVNQGTWFIESLALGFARWLNPEFAIWCDDRLKELLKYGATALTPELLLNEDHMMFVYAELKKQRLEKERLFEVTKQLEAAITHKDKTIQIMKPKSELADRIIATNEKVDIGQVAKILNLGFGRNTLFQKLKSLGILFKEKGRNEPKQEYVDRGYFELKEVVIEIKGYGNKTFLKLLVTQKGLAYIAQLFPSHPTDGQLALIE